MRKLIPQTDHLKQITTLAKSIQTTFWPLWRLCAEANTAIRKCKTLAVTVEYSQGSPGFPRVKSHVMDVDWSLTTRLISSVEHSLRYILVAFVAWRQGAVRE